MAAIRRVQAKAQYIKNPSKYDQDKQGCLICLEPASSPMRCKVCRTVFCKVCANKWLQQNRKCPKKCSQRWDLEQIPSFGVRLCCPISKKCPIILNPDNFEQHFLKCKFRKAQTDEQSMDPKHVCLQGHLLSFISNSEEKKKLYQKCTSCLQQLICRSNCEACQVQQRPSFYCGNCKIPLGITSRRCPLNHELIILKQGLPTCDLCSNGAFTLCNKYCFYDETCALAICLQCQKKLPIRRKERV